MKILRKNALELYAVLTHANFEMPMSSRFRYMLSQNVKKLQDEVDAVKNAYPEPEAFLNAEKSYKEILARYSIADATEVDQITDEESKSKAKGELDALLPTYKSAKEEYEVFVKERNEFLAEEVDIALDTVKIDVVPDISKDNQWPHWEIWNVLELIIKPE